MHEQSPPTLRPPTVLATDLDGTLIPLEGNERNLTDLQHLKRQLAEREVMLAFVTGRHLEIVEEAIDQYGLPLPDWIICDVGTSIYRREPGGWAGESAYGEHLASISNLLPIDELRSLLAEVAGLRLQEPAKQGIFKLSYYADHHALEDVASRISALLEEQDAPWSLISSIDPFTREGLIDLLPRGVSKAYALEWWRRRCRLAAEEVIFAGDSGNDWAALVAGYRVIVVSNADEQLARRVDAFHADREWEGRLHLAGAPATSGVYEGCRAFGLLSDTGGGQIPQTGEYA